MSRETIPFEVKLRIADWLRTSDEWLTREAANREDAYQKCKKDLGIQCNYNHFEGVRRSLELKWNEQFKSKPRVPDTLDEDIYQLAVGIRTLSIKLSILVPARIEEICARREANGNQG